MATESKVSALAVTGGIGASGWITPSGRHGLSSPIDPLTPAGFYGINDLWQGSSGDAPRGQGGFRYATKRQGPFFTPLVARMAAAFPANEAISDGRVSPVLFLVDLRRAVAAYELNMRLTGGSLVFQGSLVNRYS